MANIVERQIHFSHYGLPRLKGITERNSVSVAGASNRWWGISFNFIAPLSTNYVKKLHTDLLMGPM
jgi:hypothetical protein